MPIKLSQFRQEFKRRNVVRVFTFYAGVGLVKTAPQEEAGVTKDYLRGIFRFH